MAARHSARLSPIQAETVWTLEDGCVVERRGGHLRRFPMAELKGVRRADRGAILLFGRRRLTIPALSYEGLRPRDRSASFEAFMTAVTGQVPTRQAPTFGRAPIYWIIRGQRRRLDARSGAGRAPGLRPDPGGGRPALA